MLTQLAAFAQVGSDSGTQLNEKPPVGDFYPGDHPQVRIIQDVSHLRLPAPDTAKYWTGTYSLTGVITPCTYLKKIVITEEEDKSIKICAWIVLDEVSSDPGPFEFSMEAKATAYRDYNSSRMDDALIASFSTARYKPLVVITSEPALKRKSISYSCYIQGYHGNSYTTGRLERQRDEKVDAGK